MIYEPRSALQLGSDMGPRGRVGLGAKLIVS